MANGVQEGTRVRPSPEPREVPPSPVGPIRRRRQPRMIIAGLLAIVLAGLGSAALFTSITRSQGVLVVNSGVARGEVIETGDLGVTQVGSIPGVSTVPAAEANRLVGQRALVDLPKGSLLPAGAIGQPPGRPGQATVGLKLAPGRLPNAPLPAGTALTLVVVGDAQNPSGVRAESLGLATPAGDGISWLLDVLVAEEDAAEIARLAGTDAIAVIKDGS